MISPRQPKRWVEFRILAVGNLFGALISFSLEGAHPHDIGEILGREGVCVRAGHHCAQPLMRRLGVHATTRASFAVHNSVDDVARLVQAESYKGIDHLIAALPAIRAQVPAARLRVMGASTIRFGRE